MAIAPITGRHRQVDRSQGLTSRRLAASTPGVDTSVDQLVAHDFVGHAILEPGVTAAGAALSLVDGQMCETGVSWKDDHHAEEVSG